MYLVSSLAIYNAVCYQSFQNDISVDCSNLQATPAQENVVQSQSALWNTWIVLAGNVPACVAGLVLGKPTGFNKVAIRNTINKKRRII